MINCYFTPAREAAIKKLNGEVIEECSSTPVHGSNEESLVCTLQGYGLRSKQPTMAKRGRPRKDRRGRPRKYPLQQEPTPRVSEQTVLTMFPMRHSTRKPHPKNMDDYECSPPKKKRKTESDSDGDRRDDFHNVKGRRGRSTKLPPGGGCSSEVSGSKMSAKLGWLITNIVDATTKPARESGACRQQQYQCQGAENNKNNTHHGDRECKNQSVSLEESDKINRVGDSKQYSTQSGGTLRQTSAKPEYRSNKDKSLSPEKPIRKSHHTTMMDELRRLGPAPPILSKRRSGVSQDDIRHNRSTLNIGNSLTRMVRSFSSSDVFSAIPTSPPLKNVLKCPELTSGSRTCKQNTDQSDYQDYCNNILVVDDGCVKNGPINQSTSNIIEHVQENCQQNNDSAVVMASNGGDDLEYNPENMPQKGARNTVLLDIPANSPSESDNVESDWQARADQQRTVTIGRHIRSLRIAQPESDGFVSGSEMPLRSQADDGILGKTRVHTRTRSLGSSTSLGLDRSRSQQKACADSVLGSRTLCISGFYTDEQSDSSTDQTNFGRHPYRKEKGT